MSAVVTAGVILIGLGLLGWMLEPTIEPDDSAEAGVQHGKRIHRHSACRALAMLVLLVATAVVFLHGHCRDTHHFCTVLECCVSPVPA